MNQTSRIPFNKVRVLTVASCLVLIAIFQPVFAQPSKSQKIDALMKPFVQANQFSGVVLASENGKVIYEKAFGLAKCRLQNSEPGEYPDWDLLRLPNS